MRCWQWQWIVMKILNPKEMTSLPLNSNLLTHKDRGTQMWTKHQNNRVVGYRSNPRINPDSNFFLSQYDCSLRWKQWWESEVMYRWYKRLHTMLLQNKLIILIIHARSERAVWIPSKSTWSPNDNEKKVGYKKNIIGKTRHQINYQT